LAFYAVLGIVIGLASVAITRLVYRLEDTFAKLPVHWMWWPALGAIVVGDVVGRALLVLVALKLLSWSVYLGSGTSGGTLAPLFTIGGGLGALLGALVAAFAPTLGVDPHVSALVGMAAIFAGASHALLASVIFAFETTRQPLGLLPLLGGCTAAYLISSLMMRSSIMTEKLARRGTHIRTEYTADYLDRVLVRDAATREVVTIEAAATLADIRAWLATR